MKGGSRHVTQDFLYGIVEGVRDADADVRGLDGSSRVRVVVSGELGAVVSTDSSVPDLRDLPREALLAHLVAYQRVVEQVMEQGSVLPVTFGTRLDSDDEARDLVSQNRTTLGRAFARMRGTVELEVAATWAIGAVVREIGRDPEVVSLRQAIEQRGDPTPEDRVALGRLVESQVELQRAAIRKVAVDALEPLAMSTATHALVDDRLVMNEAFLLKADVVPEFEQQVRRIDTLFGGQIDLRIVGPLPPYTFCTVHVTRVTAEERERARQALRLPDGDFDERTIRDAYRRAAAAAQRQSPAEAPAEEPRGGDLKGASELLLDLARTDPADGHLAPGGGDRWIATIRTTGLDDISAASFGGGT